MRESEFQANLIKELKYMFTGCIVLKNDAGYIQGFPDLLVLFEDKWAALECKAYLEAPVQPNQNYYVETLNRMFFAAFISPENKEEILDELQLAFGTRR